MEEAFKNLKDTEFSAPETKEMIKIPIMRSRTSSRWSIALAIVPVLFLVGLFFKHYLGVSFAPLTAFYEWVGELDRKYGDNSFLNWMIRFLLLGGPLLMVFLNVLAITHVIVNKQQKELIITIQWKRKNIILGLLGGFVFMMFFGYLVVENL